MMIPDPRDIRCLVTIDNDLILRDLDGQLWTGRRYDRAEVTRALIARGYDSIAIRAVIAALEEGLRLMGAGAPLKG